MKTKIKRLLTSDDEEKVKSGKCTVVTRDGRVMTTVKFNYDYHGNKNMIVAYNDTDCVICDKNGYATINASENHDDLFVEYEDYDDCTKFEEELSPSTLKRYTDKILDILGIKQK